MFNINATDWEAEGTSDHMTLPRLCLHHLYWFKVVFFSNIWICWLVRQQRIHVAAHYCAFAQQRRGGGAKYDTSHRMIGPRVTLASPPPKIQKKKKSVESTNKGGSDARWPDVRAAVCSLITRKTPATLSARPIGSCRRRAAPPDWTAAAGRSMGYGFSCSIITAVTKQQQQQPDGLMVVFLLGSLCCVMMSLMSSTLTPPLASSHLLFVLFFFSALLCYCLFFLPELTWNWPTSGLYFFFCFFFFFFFNLHSKWEHWRYFFSTFSFMNTWSHQHLEIL